MKKYIGLMLFTALLVFFMPAQVKAQTTPTIEIVSVVSGEQDGYKGEFVTFTVQSEDASGYSVNFLLEDSKGKIVGGAGGYGYPESEMFSHTTTTLTRFIGMTNQYIKKTHTWVVSYNYLLPDGTSGSATDSYTVNP